MQNKIKEVSVGHHVEKKKNMVVLLLWTCLCVHCVHMYIQCVFVPELFPPRGPPHGLLANPVRTRLTCSVILCNLSQSCLACYSNLPRQPLHLCSVSTQSKPGRVIYYCHCICIHLYLSVLSIFLFPSVQIFLLLLSRLLCFCWFSSPLVQTEEGKCDVLVLLVNENISFQ